MTKKFLAAVILAFALVIAGGQASTAEAREVYVGSYSDGTSVYLLTETVHKRNWAHAVGYECSVRAGRDYLNYTFWFDHSRPDWQYKNSEGYSGYVYDGSSPVAATICNYLRNSY